MQELLEAAEVPSTSSSSCSIETGLEQDDSSGEDTVGCRIDIGIQVSVPYRNAYTQVIPKTASKGMCTES